MYGACLLYLSYNLHKVAGTEYLAGGCYGTSTTVPYTIVPGKLDGACFSYLWKAVNASGLGAKGGERSGAPCRDGQGKSKVLFVMKFVLPFQPRGLMLEMDG